MTKNDIRQLEKLEHYMHDEGCDEYYLAPEIKKALHKAILTLKAIEHDFGLPPYIDTQVLRYNVEDIKSE